MCVCVCVCVYGPNKLLRGRGRAGWQIQNGGVKSRFFRQGEWRRGECYCWESNGNRGAEVSRREVGCLSPGGLPPHAASFLGNRVMHKRGPWRAINSAICKLIAIVLLVTIVQSN